MKHIKVLSFIINKMHMNYYVQRPLSLNHILMKVNCLKSHKTIGMLFWGFKEWNDDFKQKQISFLDVNIYLNIYIDPKNLNFKNVFIQTQVLSSQNQNLRNSISCAQMQLKKLFCTELFVLSNYGDNLQLQQNFRKKYIFCEH